MSLLSDIGGSLGAVGHVIVHPTSIGSTDFTPGYNAGISRGVSNLANIRPSTFIPTVSGSPQSPVKAGNTPSSSDPNNPGTTTTSNDTVTAPAVNPNQPYIDIINSALGRLPGEEAAAEKQVNQTFNTNSNTLNSGKAQANATYNDSTNQNGQQFVTNKDQITDEASTGLRSLLSILAAHGAGGSSAARYLAPNAVSTVETQQREGAGQNFGQNQQALDTNWNNYLTGYDSSKQQLNDWLTQQIHAAKANEDTSASKLNNELVSLQPSVAAAQPIIDRINAESSAADKLQNFSPTYTGTTPVYTAPPVSSYTVGQVGAPVLGTPGDNTAAGATPTLSFLLGLNKDKNTTTLPATPVTS